MNAFRRHAFDEAVAGQCKLGLKLLQSFFNRFGQFNGDEGTDCLLVTQCFILIEILRCAQNDTKSEMLFQVPAIRRR